MPNRSLDDFVDGTDDAPDADESPMIDNAGSTAEEAPSEAPDPTGSKPDGTVESAEEATLTVEEATPTYDFSPGGSRCASCGETTLTRWHDTEAGMVCVECKKW
jgi:hypothetical protein